MRWGALELARGLARMLPDHKSLAGYMERRTLLHVGRLHIRLHRIRSCDATPFLHSHPFSYLSVILRGGYVEQTERGIFRFSRGAFLWRPSTVHHRLVSVDPGTLTLFITWKRKDNDWRLVRPAQQLPCEGWIDHPRGIYVRQLYGRRRLCKFDGFWRTAADTIDGAWASTRPSIDQSTQPSARQSST